MMADGRLMVLHCVSMPRCYMNQSAIERKITWKNWPARVRPTVAHLTTSQSAQGYSSGGVFETSVLQCLGQRWQNHLAVIAFN